MLSLECVWGDHYVHFDIKNNKIIIFEICSKLQMEMSTFRQKLNDREPKSQVKVNDSMLHLLMLSISFKFLNNSWSWCCHGFSTSLIIGCYQINIDKK